MLALNFKNNNLFVTSIYLFIALAPWALFKSQIAILGGIIFLVGIFIKRKDFFIELIDILKFKPLMLFGIFIFYMYLSILGTEHLYDAYERVYNYTKYYFLFIPVLLLFLDKEKAQTSIHILIISFSLYALYTIFIYFGFIHIDGSTQLRPHGHIRYSIIGQYMTINSLLSIVMFAFTKTKKLKAIYLLIFILSSFSLFINHSRTAQVAFLLVAFCLTFIYYRKNKFQFKYIFITIVFLGISSYVLEKNGNMDRYRAAVHEVKQVIKDHEFSGAFGTRLFFNKTGLNAIKENPFFGLGPYDNRVYLANKQESEKAYKGKHIFNHYHSEQMDTLTAYGLVGYLILFSSFTLLLFKLRNDKINFYLAFSVFSSLFFISFATKTLSIKPMNYIYIIFFILFSIIAYHNEKNKKSQI